MSKDRKIVGIDPGKCQYNVGKYGITLIKPVLFMGVLSYDVCKKVDGEHRTWKRIHAGPGVTLTYSLKDK